MLTYPGSNPIKRPLSGPLSFGSAGGAIGNYVPSCVFDLDATLTSSYSSGQTWLNIEGSPADGSAKSAYNFYLGVDGTISGTDPTFNGTGSSAYWSTGGAAVFRIAGGNTTLINNLHKTTGGASFWIALCGRVADGAGSYWWATGTTNTSNGVRNNMNSTEGSQFIQGNGTAIVSNTASSLVAGTDYMIIYSYTTSGQVKKWVNTSVGTEQAITFGTTTSAPTGTFTLLGSGAATPLSIMPAGTRLYSVSMGNAYLTDEQAAAIRSVYQSRHKRTY